MNRRMSLIAMVLMVGLVVSVTWGGVLDRVGAMGDSLTDKNLESGYPTYQNWAMQLASERGVNFGPSSIYNRALSGATTGGMPSQAQYLVNYDVTLAVIWIGPNDLMNMYSSIPARERTQAQLDAILAGMINNFDSAVTTVAGTPAAPSGRKMVFLNCTSLNRTPAISFAIEHTSVPGMFVQGDWIVQQFNAHIRELAIEYGFPVVDTYQYLEDLMGPVESPNTYVMFGDVVVDLTRDIMSPPPKPAPYDDGYWVDGFHANTSLQGLVANCVIEAVNRAYCCDLEYLSDQEILTIGGGTTTPGLTTHIDIRDYIFVPDSPPGDFSCDGNVDNVDLAIFSSAWFSDYNVTDIVPYAGDGTTNLLDFAVLAAHWLE
ncbi:MAG: SGNH/GDSL hydrolase family protein [Sedimentisphaerales bacterium]|nr:SGNH/GDSL hydrolase family protein [Sedimentisphaerales bacterium]